MNQAEQQIINEEIQVVPRSPKRRLTGDRALLERLSALSSHRSSARSSMGNTLSSKRSSKTNSGFIHGIDSNSTDLVNSLVATTSNNDLATSAELYNVLRKLHDSIDQLESEDLDPLAASHNSGSGMPASRVVVGAGDNLSGDILRRDNVTNEPSEKHHRLSDPFLPEERELVESLLLKYGHWEPRDESAAEQHQSNHPHNFFNNENNPVVGGDEEEERMVFSSKVKIRGTSPRHSRKGSVKRTTSKSTLNSLSFLPSVTSTEKNDDDTINEEETTPTPSSPTSPVQKHHDDSVFDALVNTEPPVSDQKQQYPQHQHQQLQPQDQNQYPYKQHHSQQQYQHQYSYQNQQQHHQHQYPQQQQHQNQNTKTTVKNTVPKSTLLKNDRLLDHVKEMDPTTMMADNNPSKGSTPSITPKMGGTPSRTRKVSTVREFAMRFEAAQQQQYHQQHRNPQSRQPLSQNSLQQQQQQQQKRFHVPKFTILPEPKSYNLSSSSSADDSDSDIGSSSSSEYDDAMIVKTNEGFIIPDEAINKLPMIGKAEKAQRLREEQEEIERQFKKENFLKDLPTSRRGIKMPTGSAGKVNQLKSKFEGTG